VTPVLAPPPEIDPDDIPRYLEWKRQNPDAVQGRAPRARAAVADDTGVVCLADIRQRRTSWLWKGRIPLRAITMLDGDPGVAKSTIAIDWAARVTTGRKWPDGQRCTRGSVLILTAEESLAETIAPRIELACGDASRVFVLRHIPGETPRLPSLPLDIPYIQAIITRQKIRLVIIDVLSAFLGGESKVNSHQDTEVRRALYPLYLMAERTGCAVVAVRHLNKMSALNNAMYRGGGSIAITGQARAVYLAAMDPDDPTRQRRVLCPVKLNLGILPGSLSYRLESHEDSDVATIAWHGESKHAARDLLGAALDDEDQDERDQVVTWVQDYLFHAGGSAGFGEVLTAARKHGIAERTLNGARRRAGVDYKRGGWQGGTVWILSPAMMDELADEAKTR
jgi:hypothetical protein